jgi:hypothetical protein
MKNDSTATKAKKQLRNIPLFLPSERRVLDQLKTLRLEWLKLRMKVMCDHAFFKKALMF